MKARSTKIFPPIVRIIHKLRLIAIKMVCQRLNGAKTGTRDGSELDIFGPKAELSLVLFLKTKKKRNLYEKQE